MKFKNVIINESPIVIEIHCKHKSKYIPFSEYPNLKKEYPVLAGNRFRFFDETTAAIMQEAINDLTPKKAKKETEE